MHVTVNCGRPACLLLSCVLDTSGQTGRKLFFFGVVNLLVEVIRDSPSCLFGCAAP